MEPDLRDGRTPPLIPSGTWHPPSSRGIHALSWLRLAGTGFGIARLQAPRGQQPCQPLVVDHVPWRTSPGGHPAPAIKGGPRLLWSDQAHALEGFPTLPVGHLVKTGPSSPHECPLPGHADLRVIWLDHAAPRLRGALPRFFQPVHLPLEWPNLLRALGLQGVLVVLALGTSGRDNMRHLLLELMLPGRALGRMHPRGTGSLVDRFRPWDGFPCHPGVELSAGTFPLGRPLSSPPRSHIDTAFYLHPLSSFWGALYCTRGVHPGL